MINKDQENEARVKIYVLYKEHYQNLIFGCEKHLITIPDALDEKNNEVDEIIKKYYPKPKQQYIDLIRKNEITGSLQIQKLVNECISRKFKD